MNVTNRISTALGNGANERQLNQIQRIVIHHTVATRAQQPNVTSANLENGWRTSTGMGAPNARGGYHEIVLFSGNVDRNMQDERRTWGAGDGSRFDLWHIAAVGTHRIASPTLGAAENNITQTQLDSMANRIAAAMRRFGWSANNVDRIVAHRDISGGGYCTNINLTNLRNAVSALLGGSGPTPPPPTGGTHTVRAGETLWGIAQMHNTTVAILQQLNNLGTSTTIQVGQVLRLPGGSGGGTHTVRAGETLWGIAQMHNTTVAILQQLNNLGTSTTIQVGQVLRLP